MAKKTPKTGKTKPKSAKNAATTVLSTDKPSTSQQATHDAAGDAGIWKDERFQHLLADPRFRGVPKVQRKVKVDKRFMGMFNDEKFKVKYTVDKYGRPVNKSNAEDLRKFYDLDESSADDDDDDDDKVVQKKDAKAAVDSDDDADAEQEERRAEELAIARDENDALDSDGLDVDEPKSVREHLTNPNIDYARGEGCLLTDSSSDDESSDDDDDPELQIDHVWGELDNDAETTEDSTKRLAACNMDWDRIRAQDLMVLCSSFLPPGGSILSVKIYPSEFGKTRMAQEEMHGPTELVGSGKLVSAEPDAKPSDDETDEELVQEQDSDAEEGDDYHMEKLRQYQLNRLRYYYAIIDCDCVATADKLYKECDGIEYESSATRVDLRFVPDDTSFDECEPRDECYELPDANSYKPRQFTTTALQQAKVDLTWDETALERRELGDKLSSGKVDDLNDKELRQIVAYSTEESESENEPEQPTEKPEAKAANKKQTDSKAAKQKKRIETYKSLLSEIYEQEKQAKEQKYEMQMSWNINEVEGEKQQQQKQLAADKQASTQLTPIEKVMQKRSEKNKQRKELRRRKQLEAQGIDPDAAAESDDSIPDGIDMNDAYFAEEFANGDYEPLKPLSKQAKSKKQKQGKLNDDEAAEAQRKEQELALLLDDDDQHVATDGVKRQHFSLAKILKTENEAGNKRKRRKQLRKSKTNEPDSKPDDDFAVDLNDSRFTAVYKSHEYNIDPSDSHYKNTKGMQQIIGEKLKRRQQQVDGNAQAEPTGPSSKRSKQQLQNSLLVKSLKRKLEQQSKS